MWDGEDFSFNLVSRESLSKKVRNLISVKSTKITSHDPYFCLDVFSLKAQSISFKNKLQHVETAGRLKVNRLFQVVPLIESTPPDLTGGFFYARKNFVTSWKQRATCHNFINPVSFLFQHSVLWLNIRYFYLCCLYFSSFM